MKHKYDSLVVYLYSIGKQQILPKEFRKQIPYSTIAGWRQHDYTEYIGHEFRTFFSEAFDNAELNYKYHKLNSGLKNLTRAWVEMKKVLLPLIKKAGRNKNFQKRILKGIAYMNNYLGLNMALKLVGITKTQYAQWMNEARYECFESQRALCVKRHPHQISKNERERMEKMLMSHKYEHWPIVSIHSKAFRDKEGTACLTSWYDFARFKGIKRKLIKKEKKLIGLKATRPNEYWHVDSTFYELLEDPANDGTGKKIVISFVMDNYSKMILGFHILEGNTAEIVKGSVSKALKVVKTHPEVKAGMKEFQHSYLVTDGGSENHNRMIDSFIARLTNYKITKIRALKHIRFSNSPVEAIHKTIKGRYLKRKKFISIPELKRFLNWAVNDYNELRPHSALKHRTPHEVYFGIPLGFDVNEKMKMVMQNRVRKNKCTDCIQCTAADVLNNRKKRAKPCKDKDCELRTTEL